MSISFIAVVTTLLVIGITAYTVSRVREIVREHRPPIRHTPQDQHVEPATALFAIQGRRHPPEEQPPAPPPVRLAGPPIAPGTALPTRRTKLGAMCRICGRNPPPPDCGYPECAYREQPSVPA